MRVTLYVLLALLIPSAGYAQGLKLPTAVYVAGAGLDLSTTMHGMSQGGHREGNPVLSSFGTNRVAVGSAMLGLDVIAIWQFHKLKRQGHPRLAVAALLVAGSVRAASGIRNARLIAQSR